MKKVFMVLSIILILSTVTVNASEIEDFKYYKSTIEEIEISEDVTDIGIYAFAKSHINNVTIPEGVTEYSNGLFYGCFELKGIDIGSNVTSIGYRCFSRSSLESIDIPENVQSIGREAFAGCENLTSVNVYGNEIDIPYSCFRGDGNLSEVNLTGVKNIDGRAFENCSNLINVIISDTVEYISDTAFLGCNKKLTIVTTEGSYGQKYALAHGISYSEQAIKVEPEIEKISLEDAMVELDKDEYIYNGKNRNPGVSVILDGEELIEGRDYTLTYYHSDRPGTASAIVTGAGNYIGSISTSYKIKVTNIKSLKVKVVKKKIGKRKKRKKKFLLFKGKKENSSGVITGYQIAYKRTNESKFTRKRVRTTGSLDYKIRNLKKKKYIIKVRCYVYTCGKSFYSTWSKEYKRALY